MNATANLPIVGVDLAKSVFQLAVADGHWQVVESHRLTRSQFESIVFGTAAAQPLCFGRTCTAYMFQAD